jgi:hypothetical protein
MAKSNGNGNGNNNNDDDNNRILKIDAEEDI